MLLLTVAFLVVLTGIAVSQIVIRNYGTSLISQAVTRAEGIARKLALDVADKILINDIVAVQKILDDQLQSEPSVSYLFILSDRQVLVHTFQDGLPVHLIHANNQGDMIRERTIKLVSEKNERFVDIRWPIFNTKAGVLRLGISEAPLQEKVKQLSIRMTLMTLAVLAVSLLLSRLLIFRLLRPLIQLTEAVKGMDENSLDAGLDIKGPAEIEQLVSAYNGMMGRIGEHTTKLKESNQALDQRNRDLDRAHHQLVTAFSVSRRVAALSDLKTIGSFLVKTLQDIVKCGHLSMVVFDNEKRVPYLAVGNNFIVMEKEDYDPLYHQADREASPVFLKADEIKALPQGFMSSSKMAVFPFHYQGQLLGAILIACPQDCVCIKTEIEVIHLILEQASGAVFRALEYEKEIRGLKTRVDTVAGFQGMVGKDPKID